MGDVDRLRAGRDGVWDLLREALSADTGGGDLREIDLSDGKRTSTSDCSRDEVMTIGSWALSPVTC